MEALQAEVLKHARLMMKNNKTSETTKLLAVSGIAQMYSFEMFNQFVNLMQELIETTGTRKMMILCRAGLTCTIRQANTTGTISSIVHVCRHIGRVQHG